MNLTAFIESAESRFKQILEDFFVSVYDEKNLYSHGIDHHRRVWNYAKELLTTRLIQSKLRPACDPSKLIIVCYLHDIGMSVEPGPRHGFKSRELCIQFLNKYKLSEYDYEDVLDTIMNHDNKDYTSDRRTNDLLKVLSVADDLDAFGFTGIYRYSEIYLTRGVNPHQLGLLVLENAEKRFKNFEDIYGVQNFYVKFHRKRYEILCNFFRQYNEQADSCNFITDAPESYCGVIKLFMLLIKNKMAIKDLFTEAGKYQDDIVIGPFINGLKSELSPDNKHE
jgi:HD superfamily phosphodiesterase